MASNQLYTQLIALQQAITKTKANQLPHSNTSTTTTTTTTTSTSTIPTTTSATSMTNLEAFYNSTFSASTNSSFSFDTLSSSSSASASSASSSSEIFDIPHGAARLAFAAAILITIVGIAGNAATIAALAKFSKRSIDSYATTRFVIYLAISDLAFCALVLPLNAGRYFTRSWPFGEAACRVYPVVYYGSVACSLMMIMAITVNRLILIAYNRRYAAMYTRSRVTAQIVVSWLLSYGIMLAPFAGVWGRTGFNRRTFSCTILRDRWGRSPKKGLFTVAFLLPAAVIVVCYTIIFVHVKRKGQKRNRKSLTLSSLDRKSVSVMMRFGEREPAPKSSRMAQKRDSRLTLLIAVVFVTFTACFMPLFVGNVLLPEDRWPYFHVFASIFAWMNACVNPAIYFALNARYRNAFARLFRCGRSSPHSVAGQSAVSGPLAATSCSETSPSS